MKVRRHDRGATRFDSLTEALLDAAPSSRSAEIVAVSDGELLAYSDGERAAWIVTKLGKKLIADEVYGRVA